MPIEPRSKVRVINPASFELTLVTDAMLHRSQARVMSLICSQLTGPCSHSIQTASKPSGPKESIISLVMLPDITGMAGPVFRVLTDRDWDGQTPSVQVVPGISALQSAASLLGSPLMQDFCAISLSNLLTPWETITKRLEAAALGDFVVVLYNPRSLRRTWQLPEARRILLEKRSGETPVGLIKDAYRPGQRVILTSLENLEDRAEEVDMFTTVVVGNSVVKNNTHSSPMPSPRKE